MSIFRILTVLSLFVANALWAQEASNHWNYALFTTIETHSSAYWMEILSKSHTISYTGNTILSNGMFRAARLPKDFVSLSKNYKIRLIPLITAVSKNGSSFLTSNATMELAIRNIIDVLHSNRHLAGIHLDIESIPKSEIVSYKRFLRILKERFPKDRVITIAVFPQVEFPNPNYVIHSDLFQEEAIDEFVLMSYDYHSPQTPPGPVTSISLTKKNLEFLFKRMDVSKLWLGLPLYGYFWNRNGTVRILTQKDLQKKNSDLEIVKHEDGFSILKNSSGTGAITDLKTLEKYKELAQSFRLKGTAFWRIGF
ncbi:glycosyl hydrolase family 18 protein [Leptospira yasudae]|uniref:Glycosyl hydrolase n=1 Tax=Leptospira yasudae TaxID=2202201 RepID=A0A6N4QVQ1_9LEPT|nr:glycosyl hydrolase family 18 protein [Leptospira yasudae]TGL78609.1 glycosyl hydrolase [Leptospira yasudae]TGL79947.1 glycosyl hydrolase [Leptospira yasudae]TGL80768.1 glycosyl hydrolase [Leptospira yasudae]